LLTNAASAATRVWGFYGWGDNAFGTSSGVDDIAVAAGRLPHVVSVRVLRYWETQRAADEIMAAPRHDRIVIYGYSCGANAVTTIAFGLHGHRHLDLAGIQPSIWCGGHNITPNVPYAQQTFAGCIITLGLGCRRWHPVPGNTVSDIVRIRRPSLHSWADTDPAAQRDVLSVIAREPGLRHQDIEIVRY
ncbi:MAG TPA: hypothetical protein VHT52_16225, partial [Stellaceae bacterium]|nr:hypothetical protein [Stellaceae bacterium]